MAEALRFAILASGRGSNAEVLMDVFSEPGFPAELVLVLSNVEGAPVLEKARRRGFATVVVPHKGRSRRDHEEEVLEQLADRSVGHLLLAGYMRILSGDFLGRFPGVILNIHPSLLPAFPGLDAPRRQWEAGVLHAGATVHFVDQGVDTGAVFRQAGLLVRGDEGAQGLSDRLLAEVEHRLYPAALRDLVALLVAGENPRRHGHALEGIDRTLTRPGGPTMPAREITPLGTVRRALLSVYDKAGLLDLARALAGRGVELLASGGTAAALRAEGIPLTPVEEYTGAKEVLGGRVKTLHPRIHAGILADRSKPEHLADLETHDCRPIDLVVCNLYPFEETLASGAKDPEVVEKIDVGGPCMVRAAAKNADGGVTVLTDPSEYPGFLTRLAEKGFVPAEDRRRYAALAFATTAAYDAGIAAWAAGRVGGRLAGEARKAPDIDRLFEVDATEGGRQTLRYGENPHQDAWLYREARSERGVANGRLLQGKELSYNNYLDLDAAYRAAWSLPGVSCAVVKHTNPCGMATAATQVEAFERALSGDRVSAFGGILGFNTALSGETAKAIKDSKLFVECIVAPTIEEEARKVLAKKTDLRLLEAPAMDPAPHPSFHRIGGGFLVQLPDPGVKDTSAWKQVAGDPLDSDAMEELLFTMRCVAALKSNAIAVTSDRTLRGAGMGVTSRVDACELALRKAGDLTRGAMLASDAFFPFPDCVELAAAAGIRAIVQPGGSKRDDEVIAAAAKLGVAMVFSGRRHFRH